jgi:hypothetical protein
MSLEFFVRFITFRASIASASGEMELSVEHDERDRLNAELLDSDQIEAEAYSSSRTVKRLVQLAQDFRNLWGVVTVAEKKEFLSYLCSSISINSERKNATIRLPEREVFGMKRNQNGRSQMTDMKRDEARRTEQDEARDAKRDKARDAERDETRDAKRDATRDVERDEVRDEERDEVRDEERDEERDEARDEGRDEASDEEGDDAMYPERDEIRDEIRDEEREGAR